MNFKSANEILDFAIQKEEEAARLYKDLAATLNRPDMKEVFESFAKEEMGHKAKLIEVKSGERMISAEKKIFDLKIGDSLVDVKPSPNLDYQHALIFAMKAEKAAYKLYNDLAQATDDENLKNLFLGLAQEEAKHKLRFEIEYDDQILTEN
ncbi:MAG: ferritin family protein [Candidatus Zixiibacteriota bacterium]|nr:MAG: ferritin family protein [candidate division Zixibacteria bacterium]